MNETTKAHANFPFSYPPVHLELIYAISEIKEAAAQTNGQIRTLNSAVSQAIIQACREIRLGKFDAKFTLAALQGGAGTSINMNVNEVVATRAEEILAAQKTPTDVHALDDVNQAQSTNDVNPSALKIACIRLCELLNGTMDQLVASFSQKAQEVNTITKLGRTHLQDAVPTTLGAEFTAYAQTFKRAKERIELALPFLYELNLGGTAIGNGINAPPEYRKRVFGALQKITNYRLKPAPNLMSQTSSQTDFVQLSQALTALVLDASKIASDLRLLSSGPNGGFGEITLKELQSGSSIMPGKVNPVLPETVNQLYFLVSGNNLTIEHAAHAAQLELGVMFPILADRLIISLKMTHEVLAQFATACIPTISANKDKCRENLERSTAYATLLTPKLGYDAVSAVVKKANTTGKTIRQIILKERLLTQAEFDELINKNH